MGVSICAVLEVRGLWVYRVWPVYCVGFSGACHTHYKSAMSGARVTLLGVIMRLS